MVELWSGQWQIEVIRYNCGVILSMPLKAN